MFTYFSISCLVVIINIKLLANYQPCVIFFFIVSNFISVVVHTDAFGSLLLISLLILVQFSCYFPTYFFLFPSFALMEI